jgi:hypothetical protein
MGILLGRIPNGIQKKRQLLSKRRKTQFVVDLSPKNVASVLFVVIAEEKIFAPNKQL